MRRLSVLLGIGAVLIAAAAAFLFFTHDPDYFGRSRSPFQVAAQRPGFSWELRRRRLPHEAGERLSTDPPANDEADVVPGTERGTAEINRIVEELQQAGGK